LSEVLGIAPLTAQVLINRGIADPVAAAAFLTPGLDRLNDPLELPDMVEAVDRLAAAVRTRIPIVVYGDYDADGVTAAAIMLRGLRHLGALVNVYIPDRRTEGYGLNVPAVETLARAGARLLVAVDCGVTAVAAAESARQAGMDLIILDHHEPLGPLPPAVAIVDPKRQRGGPADYCAAGLAFQTCRALYAAVGQEMPDELIALAALGTVADAVRLVGDNRVMVAAGLERLGWPSIPGLDALSAVSTLRPPVRTRDLSHGLAPRLNAAGRLAHARSAVRLLTTDDPEEAQAIAAELDALNQERRALCDAVLAQAIDEVERAGLASAPVLVVARSGWHPGVVGIVASQLVERYHRPTVVIALDGEVARGSARSIPPLNLVDAIGACAQSLVGFGGHAMAAGLSIEAAAIPQFADALRAEVGRRLRPEDLEPVTSVDAEVSLEDLMPALAVELERLAPYGNGNPEPVFLTRRLRAVGTRLVGDGAHLRLLVSDGVRTAETIAFRGGDHLELLAFTQARIDLAYTLEVDRWRDEERLQLVATDLQTPEVDLEAVALDAAQVLDRLFARADDYLGPRLRDVDQAPAFHTKVVGVTFDGRQELLPAVRAGERLQLARDPHNARDPHAIKVLLHDGRQLGFLSASLAARLAPSIDAGARYLATAASLTGGGEKAWGLNIFIQRESRWSDNGGSPSPQRVSGGPDLAERLFAGVYRGRKQGPALSETVATLIEGRRAVASIGPGRGLLPSVVMGALARVALGVRPVVIVLPRALVVDAWFDLAGPWLREVALRGAAAHGLLPAPAAARLAGRLERGTIDVLFASSEWIERQAPAAGSVIVVSDSLSDDDPAMVEGRYGRALCLVAGPIPPAQATIVQTRYGFEGLIVDPRTRDNLRVVDRRERSDAAITPGTGPPRPEKVLVLAATPEESVAVARRLRDDHAGASAGSIAYYHAGLPGSLRRVLEDLFAAGRLTTLICGSLLLDPSVPPDVARLAALGLYPDRLLMADALGSAGGNRRAAVIELCYGAAAVAGCQAAVDARAPSREVLAQCFRAFKASSGGRSWTVPGDHPAQIPDSGLTPEVQQASLEILIEAGVVTREAIGDEVRYTLNEGGRVDLRTSLRYREGERERAAWADLRAWATGPAARILADLAGA